MHPQVLYSLFVISQFHYNMKNQMKGLMKRITQDIALHIKLVSFLNVWMSVSQKKVFHIAKTYLKKKMCSGSRCS